MTNNFKRIIKFGWKNFRQQMSFSLTTAFIMILAVSLVTSLFILQQGSQFLAQTLREKVDMRVYFNEDLSGEDILGIKGELSRLPEIRNIEYVSKEEALSRFSSKHEEDRVIMESLEEVGKNPFLSSLNVRAWEASQYSAISSFLNNSSFRDMIAKIDYQQKKPAIERLFSLTAAVSRMVIASSAVLALVVILITFNTIRLAIKESREEIETMRLVGASNWFIRGPFLTQGIIMGALAALTSSMIFVAVILLFGSKIKLITSGFDISGYFFGNFFLLFLTQLAVGIGLGASSSWLAIRKYLKV
jgi:cell division transport system permease protein